MQIIRYLGLLVGVFVAVLAAIWVYDNQISKKIESERSNIAAAARTKSSESAFQEEQLAYAFQSIGALRLHVAEWLIVNQTIPNSNDDAKLPNPAYYQSEVLSEISIGEGGTVTALFKDFPGTLGAWVRFSPKSIDPEKMMTWKCESNIPNITQLRPTCLWIE